MGLLVSQTVNDECLTIPTAIDIPLDFETLEFSNGISEVDSDYDETDTDWGRGCPKCDPDFWEEIRSNWRNEDFAETIEDLRVSGRSFAHENLLRQKAERRKRLESQLSTSTSHKKTRIKSRSKYRTLNRQRKRERQTTADIALDSMSTTIPDWNSISGPQTRKLLQSYMDPYPSCDVTYEPSISDYYCGICCVESTSCSDHNSAKELIDDSLIEYPTTESVGDTYQDLRSRSKAKNRTRKQQEKYYNFRASRPEWVGRLCYDWTMTLPKPENGTTYTSKLGPKAKSLKLQNETECENVDLVSQLRDAHWGWLSWELHGSMVTAAKFADTQLYTGGQRRPPVGSLVKSSILDKLFDDYKDFAGKHSNFYSHQHMILQANPLARLRLKVQEWTKKDNYDNRVNFIRFWNLKRRHHSRKLTPDEKRNQKYKMRELGRNTKSRSTLLDTTGHSVNVVNQSGQTDIWRREEFLDKYCFREAWHYMRNFSYDDDQYVEPGYAREIPLDQYIWRQEERSCPGNVSSPISTPNISSSAANVSDAMPSETFDFSGDDWELFDNDTSDKMSGSDMDHLSDLDDVLAGSDWEVLSNAMGSF